MLQDQLCYMGIECWAIKKQHICKMSMCKKENIKINEHSWSENVKMDKWKYIEREDVK